MNIFAVQVNTFICHICHVNHRCLIARSNATLVAMKPVQAVRRAEDEDFIALWLRVETLSPVFLVDVTLKLKAFILLIVDMHLCRSFLKNIFLYDKWSFKELNIFSSALVHCKWYFLKWPHTQSTSFTDYKETYIWCLLRFDEWETY